VELEYEHPKMGWKLKFNEPIFAHLQAFFDLLNELKPDGANANEYAGAVVRSAQKANFFATDIGDVDALTPARVMWMAKKVDGFFVDIFEGLTGFSLETLQGAAAFADAGILLPPAMMRKIRDLIEALNGRMPDIGGDYDGS